MIFKADGLPSSTYENEGNVSNRDPNQVKKPKEVRRYQLSRRMEQFTLWNYCDCPNRKLRVSTPGPGWGQERSTSTVASPATPAEVLTPHRPVLC